MDEVQSAKNSTFNISVSDKMYFNIFEIMVFEKYLFCTTIPATIVLT
jgi:hypothetical protein